MLNRLVTFSAACFCLASSLPAETLKLTDDASITGRILAEKQDQVVVDIGYTVLTVPKASITKIQREEKPENKSDKSKEAQIPEAGPNTTPPASAALPKSLYHNPGSLTQDKTVKELVAALGEAVVQVRTPGGLGSGFFINEDGYLITNFHVIEGETQISIEVYQSKGGQLERTNYKQVRIIAMNKFADLALLKVEDKDSPKFSWVLFGASSALDVGDRVFAIGSPLGLERTVTEGILSTKTRQMQGELYLQTTTQINPGNSGGPLFNLRGEVVGVTNMKITFGEGLGFAIPVESVKFFLEHRDAFAYDNDNPSNPYRYLQPPTRMKKAASTAPAESSKKRKLAEAK